MTIYDTGHLDAEFRVFTYPAAVVTGYTRIPSMSSLITAGITASLAGWTAPDTGTPADWTEITSRTNWAGEFKTQLRDATVDWQAQLSGENYDDTLLGLGCPVVMWRRYWLPGSDLVTNGGFETHTGTVDDGTTDTFTDWTNAGVDANNRIEATATAQAGTHAVKIIRASGLPRIEQDVTVTASAAYRLTFWTRGDGTVAGEYTIYDVSNSAYITAATTTGITGTTYAPCAAAFNTPVGCTSVRVTLRVNAESATAYFDAVTLHKLGGDWQSWEIQYFGQFVASDYADDYRHGQAWRRTVAGIGYNIGRKNASRMVFGPFDVMQGATVTVKGGDTLADPADEPDKTEFYGGVANVAASNMVDGKLNTVWISDSTPLLTEDFWDPGEGRIIYPSDQDDGIRVSEVFFAPAGGQAPSTAWWCEVYNARAWGGVTTVSRWYMTIGTNPTHETEYTAGMTTSWIMPEQYELTTGRFGIICGSRSIFENMTGGAPRAQFVFDVSTIPGSIPALDQTDGFVTSGTSNGDTMIWAPSGATRKVAFNNSLGVAVAWNSGSPDYTAVATFDSDTCAPTSGYSIRRVAADYLEDDADPAHFELNLYPSPGSHSSDRDGVSMIIELEPNTDFLKAQITTASTTVELRDGTLYTLPAGSIYVQGGDTFAYTGRTGNVLTGVTGISSTHAADTQVWNYGAFNQFGSSPSATPTSAKQTGYPIYNFGWQRRKQPVPQYWQLYWSYLAADSVIEWNESGWEATWYADVAKVVGDWPADALSWSTNIYNNNEAWAWIRSFLLVIDQMNALGRAKINELTAKVPRAYESSEWGIVTPLTGGAFTAFDAVLDMSTSDQVFLYLLHDYMGMATGDLDVAGINGDEHQLSEFAISLRPLSEVLNDLARMTGCLFYPSPSGIVYWLDDKRWPKTGGMPDGYVTDADVRGELQWSDNATACDYIILNVAIPSKDSTLYERILYPKAGTGTEPASGLQGEEIDGYSVGSHWEAQFLAQRMYWERQCDGTASFTAKAATALRAGQLINVTYDWDGSGITVARRYLVEEVAEVRSGQGVGRKLDYRVALRRYYW